MRSCAWPAARKPCVGRHGGMEGADALARARSHMTRLLSHLDRARVLEVRGRRRRATGAGRLRASVRGSHPNAGREMPVIASRSERLRHMASTWSLLLHLVAKGGPRRGYAAASPGIYSACPQRLRRLRRQQRWRRRARSGRMHFVGRAPWVPMSSSQPAPTARATTVDCLAVDACLSAAPLTLRPADIWRTRIFIGRDARRVGVRIGLVRSQLLKPYATRAVSTHARLHAPVPVPSPTPHVRAGCERYHRGYV
jgi:hypothetical protein